MSSQVKPQDTQQSSTTEQPRPSSALLDKIVAESEQARSTEQREDVKGTLIDVLRKSSEVRQSTFSSTIEDLILQRIAAIDDGVSRQLDKIMHAPKFQELEATWLGLNQLVVNTRLAKDLKIKVIDVTRTELERDLGVGTAGKKSYQDSVLFQKIHDLEYGMPGGSPYGALIGDFRFSHDEHDIALLLQIAKIAAVSHAPFIAAAKPETFGWQEFKEMQSGNALFGLMQGDEYAHWERFRNNPDSRYVGLVLPRYLARTPYRRNEGSPEFTYQENLGEKDGPKFTWGNPAFVYGQVLTRAFADHGWCTAIRGQENGGSMQLPLYTARDNATAVGPTEVAVTHSRDREFSEQGFLALSQIKGTTEAVFYGGQSCQAPTAYYEDEASESAALSARLPYIFAISRFAHHLKAMMYRKIGAPLEKAELETFLHSWIMNFVLDKKNATIDEKAKFPLAAASIEVEPIKGRAGEYNAIARLRPHIQLEQINVSLRLVSRVPKQVVR
jgi:type VI secretion system protein ImpC